MGIGQVAKRTIAETTRAAEDAGTEIGAALARAARVSTRPRESRGDRVQAGRAAAGPITKPAHEATPTADRRVPKPVAKARGRRRQHRGVA